MKSRSFLPFRPFLLFVPVLISASLLAQIPTQCLEIESILVDACNPSGPCPGSTEGQNEMVRFITGPQSIAITELTATWPNNPWRGLVQNATTASLTAQLNASITSCGRLLEPPNGLIPPGSTVLLVTSTLMCVAGNSFAALTDTLYIIYQQNGNTQGHFANTTVSGQVVNPNPPAGSSVRTLTITHTPTNCSDVVSYEREQLVNIYGTYAGSSGENDGSTVLFSWPGVPQVSYVNFGCQAPFVPLLVETEADGVLCGGVGTVNIMGSVSGGTFTTAIWSGGTGTFGDPTSLSTTYTAGAGDVGNVVLQLCVQTDCADPICGTLTIPAGNGPTVSIFADGPLALCPGETVTLVASGADSYVWSTSATTASITTGTPSIYTVTGTNACGSGTAQVEVTASSGVVVTITGTLQICPGETTVLTANGAANYVWSTTETTPSIVVSLPGNYSVQGSNSCGSAMGFATVTQAPGPNVSITGDLQLCQGESSVLTASGADTYLWSNAVTGPTITVTTAGVFTVAGTNNCGTGTATATVTLERAPVVLVSGGTVLCPGASLVLTATGGSPISWNTGQTGPSITVTQAGLYVATTSNACGTDSDGITVTSTAVNSSFTASVLFGTGPLTVDFSNTSLPAGATYIWDFDDNTTSTSTSPSHTFTMPGSYDVELTVTADGCTVTSTVTITVLLPMAGGESTVFVPNVITPNGDRENDLLVLRTVNIIALDMQIFNRWGQKMTDITRVGQSWDARSPSGSQVPDGTYYYVLKATGRDGKNYDLKGHITVLR